MSNNHIYLLREREFLTTNQYILKIGKTTRGATKRVSEYPKGSQVIIIIEVENCHDAENKLKEIFIKEFKQRKDIGAEYFEGDIDKMRKTFLNIADECKINDKQQIFNKDKSLEKIADDFYDEFSKKHIEKTNDHDEISWTLLKCKFNEWCNQKKHTINARKLRSYLENYVFIKKMTQFRTKNVDGETRIRGWRGFKYVQ
mgnify:CR=1 FL=1